MASCCGYSVRLNGKNLKMAGKCSLSLAILTLFLVNGEIIKNDKMSSSAAIVNFLKQQSFNNFVSPHDKGRLTFMKRCRLVNVRLCKEGIKTTGYVWKVQKIVHTKAFGSRFSVMERDWLRARLQQLASELEESCHDLTHKIREYLT